MSQNDDYSDSAKKVNAVNLPSTVVQTTDTGTVTSAMLAGSIASSKLANSAVANLSGTNTGDQTSLPISTGISGLGTGVATALAANVGSAGAPIVNGGALGTPSSGVATNLTGTASGLTAGAVTTNANLTGDTTSSGNATTTSLVSGRTSGSAAAAGKVGELISSVIASASTVTITSSNTAQNLTSITLSAGDWDVWGNIYISPGGTIAFSYNWISLTSATLPDTSLVSLMGVSSTNAVGVTVPPLVVNVSGSTIVYISTKTSFSVSATFHGGIYARRRS